MEFFPGTGVAHEAARRDDVRNWRERNGNGRIQLAETTKRLWLLICVWDRPTINLVVLTLN